MTLQGSAPDVAYTAGQVEPMGNLSRRLANGFAHAEAEPSTKGAGAGPARVPGISRLAAA